MVNEKQQVDRNLKGIELEKAGKVDEAIPLYEANIADNFEGNHPYDRLVIIYSKRKQYAEVERVLRKAIYIFENVVNVKRGDRIPKLEKFKGKFAKLKEKGLLREFIINSE